MYKIFTESRKLRFLMRVSFIYVFLLICGIQLLSASNTKGQSLDDILVTIEIKDKNLETIIKKIEVQTRLRFAYLPAEVKGYSDISLKPGKQSVKSVLDQALSRTKLDYQYIENSIILFPVNSIKRDPSKESMNEVKTEKSPKIKQSLKELSTKRGYDNPTSLTSRQSVDVVNIKNKRMVINITGKVVDQLGQPLIGVNVLVKGSDKGTATDFEGNFSLADVDERAVLLISYIGYQSQEVVVNGQSNITITLIEDSQTLDQVVVVGYGTKEKGKLTGSVSNVNGESLAKIRTSDITKSLQGMVPGLIVNDRGGVPGSEDVDILVRGSHTLGDNSPLIVIDGVPRSGFGQLSPEDIEDVSVLKDASAAIYGAQAANGVIVVRTKRGKSGSVQLNFNTNVGLNAITRTPDMMSSWQWATYQNEVQEGFGLTPLFSEDDIQKFKSGDFPLTHPNTNFYDLTFKKYSLQTQHSLSASGGSENVQYYISGDYLRQGSQYSSNDGEYSQYQVRSNIDAQVFKSLKVGLDLNLRLQENKMPAESVSNIIHRVYFNFPSEPAFYPNGLPYFTREGGGNPVVLNSYDIGWNETIDKIAQTKFSFDYDMDYLLDGLGLSGYAAFDFDISDNELFKKPVTLYKYNVSTDEYDAYAGTVPSSGNTSLSRSNNVSRNDLYHIRLSYDKNFGHHNFNVFAAYEQNEFETNYLSAYRQNLFSTSKVELFAGEEDGRSVNGTSGVGGRVNYFGYLSYDFKRKYLVDFTVRRDGSFNFPKDHRFGLFSAVSAGWNISEEIFMAGIKDVLSNLKLRTSYGEMGNDRIPAYQYLTKYSPGSYLILGESPVYNAGMDISSIPNPNITWEVSKTFNAGFDAQFWDGKWSLTMDYFFEKRTGILIKRNESVPSYTALELPDENLGKVNNSGVELVLNHQNKVGEFVYSFGGNFSFNRSKVVFLDEPQDIPDYQKKEGHPINSIIAYDADGIFNTQAELDNYPHLSGARLGDIKYVDTNNDGVINDADRVRYFSTPMPEIQFAVNGGISVKGFSLSVLFQGQGNATAPLMFNDSGVKPAYLFTERWTEDNVNAEHPRPFAGFSGYQKLSSYHFNNASYLRLKNLEIGYNLSNIDWISNKVFKECRIYLRGRNLWTLSHIDSFDPEVPYQEDYTRGPRAKYYPQLITYSMGLNFTF